MAKTPRTYYRNYNASDTTSTTIDAAQDPTASIEEIGWEAPTGYMFSEWNSSQDGSGAAYQVGEITPYESLYAIWVKIPVPYLTTDTDLIAVADAIREKGGTSEPLEWPTGYVDAIEAIETGGGGAYAIFCPFRAALNLPVSADGGAEVTMMVTDSSAIDFMDDLWVGTSPKSKSDVKDIMGGPGAFDDGVEFSFTMPSQDVMVTRSRTDW